MTNIEYSDQELVDEKLIRATKQILGIVLGVEAAICQICGQPIPDGESVHVYAFCAAGTHDWRIGQSTCSDCPDTNSTDWTSGVRELIVTGHVGRCVDKETQSSWPVLLAPAPLAYSPADTNNTHTLGTDEKPHPPYDPEPTGDTQASTPDQNNGEGNTSATRTTQQQVPADNVDITYTHSEESPVSAEAQGKADDIPTPDVSDTPKYACVAHPPTSPTSEKTDQASESNETNTPRRQNPPDTTETDSTGTHQTDVYADWAESPDEE